MLESLKEQVYAANMALFDSQLVTLTWGNVSGIDPTTNHVVIKPSGVPYEKLQPSDMVVVDLSGKVIEGELNPSSDTPTHVFLYRQWQDIGGIVHTHSKWAVSFAQAGLSIPVYGTTHADTFYGEVPVARSLTQNEVETAYELNTGKTIVENFEDEARDHLAVPGILTNDHGPFTWGQDAMAAVNHAIALEAIAEMAYRTQMLNGGDNQLPSFLLDKHYYRKHGENAYYGQRRHSV
ncbi:L-ribulose-5-phosphate 4-epimerase [Vagococcus sp. BWB3-3]|uniref:L-ribulose-5-phosphate 4-epimerase n=1 Tax=Vagococcus allomyrinae TaxID=2794353 RepID=A0A940SXR1_9ENTE|nr:L-ribulose-5-phosphate 4-epimerase [Vagococcus allomyrinae]MBP1043571.1 L-ribulose-5-phosphate 4-epimerase [Vagococcus allomyrinae]